MSKYFYTKANGSQIVEDSFHIYPCYVLFDSFNMLLNLNGHESVRAKG